MLEIGLYLASRWNTISLKVEVDSLSDEGAENGDVLFEKSVGMGFRAQVLTNLN